MEIIINETDKKAARNVDLALQLYDLMINQRKALEGARKFLTPDYIQHNPKLPTTADGTGMAFQNRFKELSQFRVNVHRIIAVGDYVWVHAAFFYTSSPADRGVAGLDIFRYTEDGMVAEHWDVLQPVMAPEKSANTNGMF